MSTAEKTPRVVQHADDAYEAIRAICHITRGPAPAPLVYSILGNLKGVGHLLPQALTQLAFGLTLSLDKYDVYDDDGRDPAESVATADVHLARAAELAAQVGIELEKAQSAINRQGYRQGKAHQPG